MISAQTFRQKGGRAMTEQNLSAYRIFYEVAKNGNISRAAKRLYISQPAISKSIVKLEEGLDTKLFRRNSRGVTLTDEGEVLYRHIEEAFGAIGEAELELRRMKDLNIGHLRLGASTTMCRYVLLPYLRKFIKRFPNIRVSIVTQDSGRTLSLLEARKLDLGITAEPKGKHPGLCLCSPRRIHDIFVATPQYLENLREISEGEPDIFREANILLLDEHNMSRRHVDEYFKSIQREPQQVLEVSTMDLLIEFAKVGIGVSCVIKEFVAEELRSSQLSELPLEREIPSRNIGFIYSEANRSKSLDAFLSIVEENKGAEKKGKEQK